MNKYLARLKTANSETRPHGELTELTKGASVSSISSYGGGFSEPRKASVSSVSSQGERVLKIEVRPARAPLPDPEPESHPQVAEPEMPEAAVARRLDAMAAENAARRDWQTRPVEGWREGRLTIRSIAGEEITIHHPRGGTKH